MRITTLPRAALALLTCCLLFACTLRSPAPAPAAPPLAANVAEQEAAAFARELAAAAPTLDIDAGQSLIAIAVRRGGSLARFGHDHVVASRAISGRVAPAAGLAALQFRLDQLSVDEAALRLAAGMPTQPSEEAIAGTRQNMLLRVLDAAHYPLVQVELRRAGAGLPMQLQATITLHGVRRTLTLPVRGSSAADGSLRVSGEFTLRQSDYGIVPFSVLGGALAVEDQLELRFDIVARLH